MYSVLQNADSTPRKTCKKQQQLILHLKQGLYRKLQRLGNHLTVLLENKGGNASVDCDVLILFANWCMQALNFNMAGQFRQFRLM